MRKVGRLAGLILMAAHMQACDGYTYQGKTSDEVVREASEMSLPDAYDLYVDVYKNTHPPMMDAAEMFRKYGDDALVFLRNKALSAENSMEFEGDLAALAFLKYSCNNRYSRLFKSRAIIVDADEFYVSNLCTHEVRHAP